jgi:M6 family metalloprotease-like protein
LGVLALALGTSASEAHARQAGTRATPWREVRPPAPIAGLPGVTPSASLELSRAWLGRVAEVRRRREELAATGELDGLTPVAAASRGAALEGTLRIPVIPVHYADVEVPFSTARLSSRLFGASVADTLSYSDYWREVSGGLLEVTGEVAPWIALSAPASYYLPPERYGWAQFGRITELRTEALHAADAMLDFRAFDNDGPDGVPDSGDDDGFVDFVAFAYALPCPGDGRTGAIWPHRAAMLPVETADTSANGEPLKITDYVILPAVDLETCGPMHVGLLAHETGHALGLPDLYDYDGSSQGIGDWGLMGTGSHGRLFSPAHPSAWEKEQLGWVTVSWLHEASSVVRFAPVERDRTVFRFDANDGSGRYLLLENRQRIGSDKQLPGEGLLVWQVDPEPGELGIWNRDERRTAVALATATGPGSPARRRDRADPRDPLPGVSRRREFRWTATHRFALDSIESREGTVSAVVDLRTSPAVAARPSVVHFAAMMEGGPVEHAVALQASADATGPSGLTALPDAAWLSAERDGGLLYVRANPASLAPGKYSAAVRILDDGGVEIANVPVLLDIASRGIGEIVATELPWGWGLTAHAGMILQASYGRDPIGARPRPRVLGLLDGASHPVTLARLPADAVYAPVADVANGAHFVIARADDRNFVYRISPDGEAAVVAADVGEDPAYGATMLPDGTLLVAEWNGRIHRVDAAGVISPYTRLTDKRIYQIAADDAGNVFAAALDGDVIRIAPDGVLRYLETGFGHGGLVAITASADSWVYAAERGGEGRVIRFSPEGRRELLYRQPDAEFYGLALDGGFLYALDLTERHMLRLPLPGAIVPARIAARPELPASGFRE